MRRIVVVFFPALNVSSMYELNSNGFMLFSSFFSTMVCKTQSLTRYFYKISLGLRSFFLKIRAYGAIIQMEQPNYITSLPTYDGWFFICSGTRTFASRNLALSEQNDKFALAFEAKITRKTQQRTFIHHKIANPVSLKLRNERSV